MTFLPGDAAPLSADWPDAALGGGAGGPLPVLWLCGPAGVGKSAAGWELFTQLTREGVAAGFADIDQLGMCYPEPDDDPYRYRLEARNLAAVVANYGAAGAECMIVPGVVDPERGVHAGLIPAAEVTVARLDADPWVIRQRFLARTADPAAADDALEEAAILAASTFADVVIDTTGMPVAQVVRRVRERSRGWRSRAGAARPASAATHPGGARLPVPPAPAAAPAPALCAGPVLLICGATGTGKSTVGYQAYVQAMGIGLTAAYLDLEQVAFCPPARATDPGGHALKARNLAAIWQNYRAVGAQCLVAVGPVDDENAARTYAAALPPATLTLARLHAGQAELTHRIRLRGQGRGSWTEPGDALIGQTDARLRDIADLAGSDARRMEQAGLGDVRIDASGLDPAEAAAQLLAASGWPGRTA